MGSTLLKERKKTYKLLKSPKNNNKLGKVERFSKCSNVKNPSKGRNCYIRTQRVVSNRKRRVCFTGLKENKVNKANRFNHHCSHINDQDRNNKKVLFLYVLFGAVMSVIWNF